VGNSYAHTDFAIATYYIIATADASYNLARYDGVRYEIARRRHDFDRHVPPKTRGEGLGAEVKHAASCSAYDTVGWLHGGGGRLTCNAESACTN